MKNTQNLKTVQVGTTENSENIYIEIVTDGPYILHSKAPLRVQYIMPNQQGTSVAYQDGASFNTDDKTFLCRCGLSKNKPYCDQSHQQADQQGVDLTEVASHRDSLNQAEMINGPVYSLSDDEKLCAFARFCDNGRRIWNEVEYNDEDSLNKAVTMAHYCPSGRLIIWDQNNNPIEDETEAYIGLVEDVANQCSGPIALWGGIPVKSGSGKFYEVRNRQTLCRCGQSSNKPFCDGTHSSMKFQDGLNKYI